MSKKVSGRCACGAIKYTTTSIPAFTLICQRRQCQRISGSGHAAQFAVPVEETVIEGEVRSMSKPRTAATLLAAVSAPTAVAQW